MIATYIKRYNEHSAMNTNQKAFTYIDKFARKINKIIESKFFVDNKMYSDNDKNKGVTERIAVETIMCMNHFNDWKAQPKVAYKYLNDNATEEEFDTLTDNLRRLEKIITSDIMDIFNKKDSFIFLTLFDRFIRFGVDDAQFSDFLREFKSNLRGMFKNEKGLFFDEIDKDLSTKDKQVILDKLDMLEKMMKTFLGIEEVVKNFNVESFIAENLDLNVETVQTDIDFYNNSLDILLENTVKIDSKLRNNENRPSLLSMMVYSYKYDKDLDDWLKEYASKNNTYFKDQKKNYLHMKQDFERYYIEHKVSK